MVCLSGIMEEMYVVQEVIRKYNQENAERTGKMLLLLAEDAPASDADVVIGILGNYMVKVQIIEEAANTGKKVLLFFSKYQDPENTIPVERKVVEVFKKKMELKCVCCEFSGRADFAASLAKTIENIDSM